MTPYKRDDGVMYFLDGQGNYIYLSFYDPATGAYAMQNDPSNTVYDENGNSTGRTTANYSSAGAVAQNNSHSTVLDTVNTGLQTIGDLFGHHNTPVGNQPGYYPGMQPLTPAASTNSTGKTILVVLLLAVAVTVTVIVVRHHRKKA